MTFFIKFILQGSKIGTECLYETLSFDINLKSKMWSGITASYLI